MTILLHRQAITFSHPGKWNAKMQRYEGGGQKVRVAASPRAQEVPDWVATTDGFRQAEKDGLVVRIKRLSPTTQAKPVDPGAMNTLGFGAPKIEPVNIGQNKPVPEPQTELADQVGQESAEAEEGEGDGGDADTEGAEAADVASSSASKRGRRRQPVAAE